MQPTAPVTNEQINDVPFLLGVIAQMGIRDQIDACVTPHGAWQGASVGTLVCLWLCYLLSERDHRLVGVRDWVDARKETLSALLGQALRPTDCTDDRLANVLSMLGPPAVQARVDDALLSSWLLVYRLPTQTLRLDSTSVSVYHQDTAKDSLLQMGHSKDHRPDLAQFKVMLASLDPLGMPVGMQMVSGNQGDDGLYLPAYETAAKRLGTRDLLVVGDCKMAALATRAGIVAGGSRYLCPYRPGGVKPEMDAWIERALSAKQDWQTLEGGRDPVTGEAGVRAFVVEWTREQTATDPTTARALTWTERVVLVQSQSYHQSQCQILERRLARLCRDVDKLRKPPARGRKRLLSAEALTTVLTPLVAASGLSEWVHIDAYEQRLPEGTTRFVPGPVQVDTRAWEAQKARLGWQVYVSNVPETVYSTPQLAQVYHQQVLQERGFARLKTRTLHLRPVYLRDEVRLSGLVYLLCLALRVLTLTEYRLRTQLQARQESLLGLNPASRSQASTTPTTERVLAAFSNLTLTRWPSRDGPQGYVTALNATQQHILRLLDLPADLYQRLGAQTTNRPLNMRE